MSLYNPSWQRLIDSTQYSIPKFDSSNLSASYVSTNVFAKSKDFLYLD